MASEKVRYDEIARAKISSNRNMIVSRCSKGGYTVAQQLAVRDGRNEMTVFLKGAIHIEDKAALIRVRDAINVAVREAGPNGVLGHAEDWDEGET